MCVFVCNTALSYTVFIHQFSHRCENRFLASSCPSICPHVWARTRWMDIREILYLRFVLKSVEKIQIWLKMDKKYLSLYMKTSLRFRGTDLNVCDIVDSDRCTSKIQKERILKVTRAKVVTRRRPSVTLYVPCLYCL